jgi:hypothetical protein
LQCGSCLVNCVAPDLSILQRGSITDDQLKLRLEITQILKEASALSTYAIRLFALPLISTLGFSDSGVIVLETFSLVFPFI